MTHELAKGQGYKPLNNQDSIALEETGVVPPPVVYQQPQPIGPPIVQAPVSIVAAPAPQGFSTTTTTIISQQPQGRRPWSTDICGCFDDLTSCCCSLFLGRCYLGCVATRMGEHCCVGCCMGGLWPMRAAFRERHNIQGDLCNDACISVCLGPCAICQLSREMDRLGYPPRNCC